MKQRNWLLTVALLGGMLAGGAAVAGPDSGHPILRIPKMRAPPTVDGKIGEEEWAGASAVTGFAVGVGEYTPDQYPPDMQQVWYLGYDDAHLYLAMHSRIPAGVCLNAQTKNPEDMDNVNSVIFGDHVEVRISAHDPARAKQLGFGHYLFCANPFNIWSDSWEMCDEPGNETAWNSGARVKSTFDAGNWWFEMAIPLTGTMKSADDTLIRRADDLELIVHLVRAGFCGGWSWSAWTPATCHQWDKFYRVVLDPQAPVMQFLQTGSLVDGELDVQLRLRGAPGTAAVVQVDVSDPDGTSVFAQEQKLRLDGAAWSLAGFRQAALSVPDWSAAPQAKDKRNLLRLRVTADGRPLYTAALNFAKHTPELRQATYGRYVADLPKGDYTTRIAYIARNGKFRVTVDTDAIGEIPPAIRGARQFRLRIRPEGQDTLLVDQKLAITHGVGSHLLELGPLTGTYEVVLDLLDDRGSVVSTRNHRFTRVRHEWEGNTIGKERVVIPPFRPIVFAEPILKTRCAQFAFGKGGLWDAVQVLDRPLLTAPMRIAGAIAGNELIWTGETVRIEKGRGRAFPPEFDQYQFMTRECPRIPLAELPETDGYDAQITGRGVIGPVAVAVAATLDYDGHTRFRIGYGPAAAPAKVDRLEVVLDLFAGISDLGLAREVSASGFRKLPADRQGTLWESASLTGRNPRFRGTFVPLLHLGDGRFGVQFRAASDEGWRLDDTVSCMRIERHGDSVRLRLLLVNAPALLDKVRTVEFALVPLPAKTAPANSRYLMWGSLHRDYVHHAFGWRKYGTGADNWYLPTDDDYGRLGENIRERYPAAATLPTMMYSSTLAVGAPLPDCDSFKGQWYNDSEFDPGKGRAVQYGGKGKDPTGRFAWDRPECFTEARPNGWDEELNDNYLWFHRKLTALAGTNGCYWDNAEIQHNINFDAGTYGYVRDDGHVQPTNNSSQRRSLMKRLFTMSWLAGRPPLDNAKTAFQTPFQALSYMWEGNWHLYTADSTFFDAHAPDGLSQLRLFRDTLETPAMIHFKMPGIETRAFDRRGPRSYLALAVLHDIGLDRVSVENSTLLRRLDTEIGFLDRERQAEFVPYGETGRLIGFVEWSADKGGRQSWRDWQPPQLAVSVFRSQTQPGKALLWFVNFGNSAVVTGLRLDSQALVGQPRKTVVVRNLETGIQHKRVLPATVTASAEKETLWGSVTVCPREFLALVIEKGEYVPPPHPIDWP